MLFHNRSKYDFQFIIKQLSEEIKGQFKRLVENSEKHIIFSVPKENWMTVTYKISFINSERVYTKINARIVIPTSNK